MLIPGSTTHMTTNIDDIVRWIEGDESDEIARVQRLAQFTLPLNSIVAVVSRGDERLLDLRLKESFEFPHPESLSDGDPPPDAALISQLESVRSTGAHFLLIPRTSREWLEDRTDFEVYVRDNFRCVVDEHATVFALQDHRLTPPPSEIGPDGLRSPPVEMVRLTAGQFKDEWVYEGFYDGGVNAAGWINDVLSQNGLDLESFQAILDFGCGCGRIMRQWHSLRNPALYGTDYNPYLIRWCSENLPFATFAVNGMGPELDYQDDMFDLIYSASVFTHLVEPLQVPWAAELMRVTRPGGYLLFTTHGVTRAGNLSEEDRARFDAGDLVVRATEKAGTNACEAFHPEAYVRGQMAEAIGASLVGFHPDAAKGYGQDVVLFKKSQ